MSSEDDIKEEEVSDEEDFNDDNIMKILIASDIHLGYELVVKRDQQDDSFQTFEEILQYARDNNVDFVLLGGDLFHEAKPPPNVVMKCINLLRKYCLNDNPVKIQLMTDPDLAFNHCDKKIINFEDSNLNVGIPVFSIHGNHDDPSFGSIGSMDVLSATGLINYFGKWTDVTQVNVIPMIIKKGVTTVALYGLSYMNDQRLSRLMRSKKFNLMNSEEIEDPFNIFVLHQNRAQHSRNSFVSEDYLPDFLHLVVWGHEHECRILPEPSTTNKKVFICQPGSSVATSLSQGEAEPKHIGILHVYKHKFKMEALKLKTVRPFVFEDVFLSDYDDEITTLKSRQEAVEKFIDDYIENTMIPKVSEQQTGHEKQPEKPLLRLRVFYKEEQDVFDTLRLAQKYHHVAANRNDMILFRKCSAKSEIKNKKHDLEEIEDIFQFKDDEKDWKLSIQGGMADYFSQADNISKLTVLSIEGLNEALSRFVNANDNKAINDLVRHQMKKTVQHLAQSDFTNDTDILNSIKNYRDFRMQKKQKEKDEIGSFFNERPANTSTVSKDNSASSDAEDKDDTSFNNDKQITNEIIPTRGRGRGRGTSRGSRAKAPPAKRGRGKETGKLTTMLDVTTSGSSTLTSWRKTPASKNKNQSIIIDSD